MVFPSPAEPKAMKMLSKTSLSEVNNFSEIAENFLKSSFKQKLIVLKRQLNTSKNRFKGFVSLPSFADFLKNSLEFLSLDKKKRQIEILFDRNFEFFRKDILKEFETEIQTVLSANEDVKISTIQSKQNYLNGLFRFTKLGI